MPKAHLFNDGIQFVKVFFVFGTVHNTFSSPHEINVSTKGVDLSIVSQHSVWLSAVPARECVGRESRVHKSNVRFEIIIG